VLGKTGMYDMGHAMFFGIGAYTTAILNTMLKIPIFLTIPFGIIISVIVVVLFFSPIVRLKGDYLLIATLGFNMAFIQFLNNNGFGITNGPYGIFNIGTASIFGFQFSSNLSIYYLTLFFLLLTLVIIHNLDTSKVGRALFFINKDTLAAECSGINVTFYKVFAFSLSAALASIAGTLFAIESAAVSPTAFDFLQSVLFFTIVLVGGSGSIEGVLIGTFFMFVIPQIFAGLLNVRFLVFGIAMVMVMIWKPNGIWPVKFGKITKYMPKK
jgi:branched-chain amino acid transport system permease protein